MGKKAEQNKIRAGQEGVMLEHSAVYDDSLLPSAEELCKLKDVDPNIIDWIKRRTEVEQDARIDFNKKRINLASKETNLSALLSGLALVLATFIIIGVFYLSFTLVMNGFNVAGTIFGSVDLAALILAFSKLRASKR